MNEYLILYNGRYDILSLCIDAMCAYQCTGWLSPGAVSTNDIHILHFSLPPILSHSLRSSLFVTYMILGEVASPSAALLHVTQFNSVYFYIIPSHIIS